MFLEYNLLELRRKLICDTNSHATLLCGIEMSLQVLHVLQQA